MTNFEKIKKMKEHELAKFLSKLIDDSNTIPAELCGMYCEFTGETEYDCILEKCPFASNNLMIAEKWLSSEVK